MGMNSIALKKKWGKIAAEQGPTGKDYFSLTAFKLGGENGQPAGAMKFRLRPHQHSPRFGGNSAEDPKEEARKGFTDEVAENDIGFDLMIQVATDETKHPINDASVEWDEMTAPWIKMGTVRIPKQQFPGELSTGNAVGEGLWGKDGKPLFNSKELLFAPGSNPHQPLGDINRFREHLYPVYDEARQRHLLGKASGKPAECPMKRIARFLR